ncbi:MAG: thioredoxin domain-containing protein [Candidatus Saccharimonas sp.]
MNNKTWIIFSVVCVAIIGGLIALSRNNRIDVSNINVNVSHSAAPISGNIADHTFGNMKSKVILIEYGDYQCPGCGDLYPILKQITEKYQDQLGFIFRNFPLTSIHPNSLAASSTAEAASLQGKFWEVHDLLYQNQNSWNTLPPNQRGDYFASLVSNVGLDKAKFATDVNSDAVRQKISFDTALGEKINIAGTPTIFLNGDKVSDMHYNGDKITTDTKDPYVWGDAGAFEKLIIIPALQKNGIKLPE